MGHPEDIGLSDLCVITEPGDLQIWSNNRHVQSYQPETFSQVKFEGKILWKVTFSRNSALEEGCFSL